jgi:exonuclease III
LNTGNQVLDRSPAAAPYSCANDFDALSQRTSLVDLWRRTNGADAREWTWTSHLNNGFRIDHAFANDAFINFMKPECLHDHSPRERAITDHSAIVISPSPQISGDAEQDVKLRPRLAS